MELRYELVCRRWRSRRSRHLRVLLVSDRRRRSEFRRRILPYSSPSVTGFWTLRNHQTKIFWMSIMGMISWTSNVEEIGEVVCRREVQLSIYDATYGKRVNFTQKHELHQIYVRSTARVYEINYAPDLQSDNEYLCIVRCGIASRDEEVLHTDDNEEVYPANSNGSLKEYLKKT